MNNLTINLDDLPDEIKAQLTAWVAEVNKPKEWPQERDEYWLVTGGGRVCRDWWSPVAADKDRMEFGNCFRTEAEAIAYREHLKVCAELRMLADWDGKGQSHFSITSNTKGVLWIVEYNFAIDSPYMFHTKESAQTAINTIGEKRLIDHYFNYGRKV